MKLGLRFAIVLAAALALAPFLPLYVERTMTHVMFADGSGGAIEWGWKLCTLRTFFSDYRYFRHHPHPGLWITMNVALAFTYALAIALFVAFILGRMRRKQSPRQI
jgi:hypothetical protein